MSTLHPYLKGRAPLTIALEWIGTYFVGIKHPLSLALVLSVDHKVDWNGQSSKTRLAFVLATCLSISQSLLLVKTTFVVYVLLPRQDFCTLFQPFGLRICLITVLINLGGVDQPRAVPWWRPNESLSKWLPFWCPCHPIPRYPEGFDP